MTALQEQLRRAHSCHMTLTDEQPAREDDYDRQPHYRYRCANGCGRKHLQHHSLASGGPLWCYATLPEPPIIYAPRRVGTAAGCESAKINLPLKYCLCLPGIRGRSIAHLPGGGYSSPYGSAS